MTRRQRRLGILLAALACAGAATALTLNAFRSNLVFFFSPSQIAAKEAPVAQVFRLGGLVERGSIQRERDGMTIRFIVTDTARGVPVVYHGLLPDLFREGKGVVARGRLGEDGIFVANEVLAKHDENYMPPEAADALRRAAQVNEQMAKESARSASR
ncbi:cytochrome c maturation protein CcmE [Ralstonia wenshanensis]|uniref:cytochrome c maturation protein CcmE n=1 Tax=Ralstonia wenshanensis TaxID=2842456 RepID=UPI002AAE9F84|nr:cytochrome c maturation protein CcmE [Ralstonia wenshanensis]MDY7509101.1 cytochrome c maturation protein CcmE [Ralstonia wenshanensis]